MKLKTHLPPGYAGSTAPAPTALTPTQMAARWPASPPETLALTPGQWLDRDTAARIIAKANGSDDPETGMCYLTAMMRAGMVDAKGNDVMLFPEGERLGSPGYGIRPGSPEAIVEEARLSRLAADLKALGLKAVPDEPPA